MYATNTVKNDYNEVSNIFQYLSFGNLGRFNEYCSQSFIDYKVAQKVYKGRKAGKVLNAIDPVIFESKLNVKPPKIKLECKK